MSVRKRTWTTGNGEAKEAWIADFVDGAGKRHIRTFAQKRKADAYAAKVKVAVNAGTHVALDANLTVADVAQKWIASVEAQGRERTTIVQYREHVDLHIVPRIGRLRLAKLTSSHVEAFRDGLLSGVGDHKALSRPMCRKVLVSLKSMLRVVHYSHLFDGVKIGGGKRDKRKLEPGRDIPTPAEVKRLVEATKSPKLRTLLKLVASTGLRASELRGLRWSNVDLKAGELHVRQRADRFNKIGAPKTDGSRRTIPLGPDMVLTLKEWKLACPKGELDLVFPNASGGIASLEGIMQSLAPVMLAAGVVKKDGRPKYGMHAFRHFFASWCINPADRGGRELPAKVVQALLGHSSITMTLDVYGHLFPGGNDRTELAASEKALFG
jgi:integrase